MPHGRIDLYPSGLTCMTKNTDNAIRDIFNEWHEEIRPGYVVLDDEHAEERNAFCAGIVFGLTFVNIDPDDIVSESSSKTVGEELDEIFIRKQDLS